jgi:hypothetical protein
MRPAGPLVAGFDCLLVALPPVRDLLLGAKHLLSEAIPLLQAILQRKASPAGQIGHSGAFALCGLSY